VEKRKGLTVITNEPLTDICTFLEDHFLLEDGQPIRLETWQREKVLRPIFYDLNEQGLRHYNLALIGLPKKNGKSTLAAGVAAYGLLADGEPEPEIYSAAGDKEQARIIFDMTARVFRRSPLLEQEVKIFRDAIERRDGRGFYRVLSADAPTAHGLNPHFVIFDELWNQKSYDLWEALTHSPARRQPLHFCITYAGYSRVDVNLLWDLYQRGLGGEDSAMHFFWTHDNLASWVDEAYLEQQRLRLPSHIYQRLHENKFAEGSGAFITREELLCCVDQDLNYQYQGQPGLSYVYALDLGLTRDRTAAAIVHREGDGVVLDSLTVWEGDPSHPIQIATIEDHLVDSSRRFAIGSYVLDPWQLKGSAQRLEAQGYPVVEFNFSAQGIGRLSQNLYALIRAKKLLLPNDPPLIGELLNLSAVETTYGWRLDHRSGGYSDRAIALGMAALQAMELPLPSPHAPYEEPYPMVPIGWAECLDLEAPFLFGEVVGSFDVYDDEEFYDDFPDMLNAIEP
jgi:phage terminase large subunit-like protein